MLALQKDMNAQSAVASRESLLKTWLQFHQTWCGQGRGFTDVDPFPLTVLKIYAVGSLLKAGGYRSPANYMSRAEEEHVVRGCGWDDQLALAVRKTTTSITRGMGPGRQSSPLDLSRVWCCDIPWRSEIPGCPLGGKDLIVAGSFFCVREIELSLALRQHVVFDEHQSRVSWLLPSSKTDPKALGKTRSWDCVCDNVHAKPWPFTP